MTHHTPIKRLLIANRGEIAVRIIKTARRPAFATIALTRTPTPVPRARSRRGLASGAGPRPGELPRHRQGAQDCQRVRMPTPSTWLRFLSENSDFATACERAAGLRFVGKRRRHPSPGGQVGARGLQAAGVPCCPPGHGADQHPDFLRDQASQVGFPPYQGGQRRWQRGCAGSISWADFDDALAAVKWRRVPPWRRPCAAGAPSPRARHHVEGRSLPMPSATPSIWGSGDCPAAPPPEGDRGGPAPTSPLPCAAPWARRTWRRPRPSTIGGWHHRVLPAREEFFFMEMNTGCGVEHPGYRGHHRPDLVAWQLAVPGQTMPLTQDEVVLRGHAVRPPLRRRRGRYLSPASGPNPLAHLAQGVSAPAHCWR